METEHSEQEAEVIVCVRCGSTSGPHLLTDGGWLCLRHLPRLGDRRRGFRAVR
jgi:hypothetical protein